MECTLLLRHYNLGQLGVSRLSWAAFAAAQAALCSYSSGDGLAEAEWIAEQETGLDRMLTPQKPEPKAPGANARR